MKFSFARHGKTEYNERGVVAGHRDVPLSQTGINEAQALAEELRDAKFDIIFCSPLSRAAQTAEIINQYHNVPIVYDSRIIERDCGKMAGKTFAELDAQKQNWSWIIGDRRCQSLKVETVDNMLKRTQAFVDMLENKYADKNVLVVAHSGVASCFRALQNNAQKGDDILGRTANAKLLEFDVQSSNQREKE